MFYYVESYSQVNNDNYNSSPSSIAHSIGLFKIYNNIESPCKCIFNQIDWGGFKRRKSIKIFTPQFNNKIKFYRNNASSFCWFCSDCSTITALLFHSTASCLLFYPLFIRLCFLSFSSQLSFFLLFGFQSNNIFFNFLMFVSSFQNFDIY